jgi:probable H4MPT-linked C1 transfer pathway protein
MPPTVLGLDIGGANLKAATPDKRAESVPFALWRQPDRLPAVLAELVNRFPDAEELAVTMTGELCDCFETKRAGVNAILDAVLNVTRSRPVRVWTTDGAFVDTEEARRHHLKVASANWHVLATFAGRYAPHYGGLLLDVGSTTTDVIPLDTGFPATYGLTDHDRLQFRELVYVGVRRTPVCAVVNDQTTAELFATTQDAFVTLGDLPEDPVDCDTADGRPLTAAYSRARLARMLGGDTEILTAEEITRFAVRVRGRLIELIRAGIGAAYYDQQNPPELRTIITAGAGEFLARQVVDAMFEAEWGQLHVERTVSLNDELGPSVSACAPAYAVAVLAAERS